jgi:hypothetical protein
MVKFINWVRGVDVWGETEGGNRWKLGDPYHVGLVEVGAPQSLLTDSAYRTFAEIQRLIPGHGWCICMPMTVWSMLQFRHGKEEWGSFPERSQLPQTHGYQAYQRWYMGFR